MTKLRTILAAAAAIAAVAIPARATEKLYVEYKDGHVYSYVLTSRPKVTFAGNVINVAGTDISDTHKMDAVKQFLFSEPGAAEVIGANEFSITYTDNATVRLDGFTPAGSLSVYDIGGTLMAEAAFGSDGTAEISLEAMAPGIYLIATTDGKTYKIVKR